MHIHGETYTYNDRFVAQEYALSISVLYYGILLFQYMFVPNPILQVILPTQIDFLPKHTQHTYHLELIS